eukprot:TRINITY_DN81024_c0_g1_i1.p1 TRINITY_DN81024_c0_g1~~TRINITY_DN81024_c0_g1_i1.p1  ORF type:complete len:304 (+),score=76.41 TRINITY_DN81024_c0_g1_i1:84-995(+)
MAVRALLLGLALPTLADAANASAPHPHRGLIPRMRMGEPLVFDLTDEENALVAEGGLWTRAIEVEDSGIGRAQGVQHIPAPPSIVWGQIADFEGYVGKVNMLQSVSIYDRNVTDSEVVEKATYVVRVIPGFYYEYYIEHHADEEKGELLFFLDYDRESDFDDNQGKWIVEAHPEKAGWSIVHYQTELKLMGYAPRIVRTLLMSKGIESAFAWVHRESVKRVPADAVVDAFALPTSFRGQAGSVGHRVASLEDVSDISSQRSSPPRDSHSWAQAAAVVLVGLASIGAARRHLVGARTRSARFAR